MTCISGPLVLLVEDDRLIRELVAEALTDEGYRVEMAANGAEALLCAERVVPDLIVLDLMMPVMDGPGFRVKQLEVEALADVPVLILSASRNAEAECAKLAAQGFIRKPFDLDALLDMVATLARNSDR